MEDQTQKTDSENYSHDFGDTDDALSLCDLPIPGYGYQDSSRHGTPRPSVSSDQELFEFFPDFRSVLSRSNSHFFSPNKFSEDETDQVNEFQKRDYFSVKSASFHKVSGYDEDLRGEEREPRSSSLQLAKSDPFHSKKYNPVPKVNITALTAMSAKSRRRMFMFGPVKFKPEMDVTAIRRRQGRHPLQIPPMPEESEIAEERCGRRNSSCGEGVPVRPPLACRSHIAAALARSFGCMSASMV
ncbi:uncharacterized protein LOC127805507 [Diospyros lotus]|uniref:uncharacterized protein LOC127805507 n=1 Tax=Diospyros lotus TaxID=55363 RepID=UPI00225C3EBD|nr:uncharacterized protein LOC127805507 [Diospyros lotus]